MAPGGVRADEHNEVSLVEILVAAGHEVLAEGATVTGDRGRHAETRIGVDVARADEALHQLVGDVVLRELAGNVERDRVGAVTLDRLGEALGDEIERLIPTGGPAPDCRRKQAALKAEGLPEPNPWSRAGRHWPGGPGPPPHSPGRRPPPQPTPQYGQVRTHQALATRAALGTPSQTCEARSSTEMRPTQPSSGPWTSPVSRLITQLCSGQVTDAPCTSPCESGPPFVGTAVVEREEPVVGGAEDGDVALRALHHAGALHRNVVEGPDLDPDAHQSTSAKGWNSWPSWPFTRSAQGSTWAEAWACRKRDASSRRLGIVDDAALHVIEPDAPDPGAARSR